MISRLSDFGPRSTELKSRKISNKNKNKIWEIFRVKKYCIGNYIEVILGPSRHSLRLLRDGLPDKTRIVSTTLRGNEDGDLLRIKNKSTLKFSMQSWLFIRSSAREDPYVF